MLIPFSPRHFQHPGTVAVSTPTPGDQWRAFMLRSTEARCEWAVESGGLYPPSRSSCVLILTQTLSRPPRLHVNRREQNHRTPLRVSPCDPGTDPQHCLWMSVRVTASGPGATLTLSFLTPRLQPIPSPPSPRIFSVLYLFASIVPPGGRVLFAYLITRSQEPSPSSAALASPSFPGRKRHSTNVGRAPAARERRAGRPPGPRCGSPRAPPFPPVGNPGSQLPRLRHGILPPLPPASPCRLPQGGLLIGGSEGHSATLRARPRPRAGSGSSSSPYPLPLIAALRAPRSSGQSPGNWPRDRRAASGAA